MEYLNLEQEYENIFKEKVLQFIKNKIEKNYLTEPVYYLLEGLKINRFRSGLPIIIAREYKIDEEIVLPISAFCELTFTTAMAEDDFYDDDDFREGLETAHKKFGIKETLLSCNYVNNKIISIVKDSMEEKNLPSERINKILEIINEGLGKWYLSVMMEINSKKDLISIDEEYLKKIYLSKTIHGRMLLECTFLLIEEKMENIEIIKKYGEHLAIAGQIKNDIYDFTKHRKYRGLSDLKQGHITWPIFLLIKSLEREEKEKFLGYLENKKYEKLIEMLKEKKIIEKLIDIINFHVEEAKRTIEGKFQDRIVKFLQTWAEGNRNFSQNPKI